MGKRLMQVLMAGWRFVRQLTGDDSYDRYLAHHANVHPDGIPLSRQAFFKARQDKKWSGINRCC